MTDHTRNTTAARPAANGGHPLARLGPHGLRVLAGVVIVLVAGAVAAWWYYSGRESTDNAQVDGHIVAISPRVGGTVLGVKVADNHRVTAGTVLVEIDPRDFQVALQRAEADLADAQAALAAAQAGLPITSTTTASQVSSATANVERAEAGVSGALREVEAARSRLASAEARLREARAHAQRATRDFERLKPLLEKDEVSQQQYDAAAAAAEAASAAVESATAVVNEAKQAVSIVESRQAQAAGTLTQAQADRRSAGTAPEQVAVSRARVQSAEARVLQARAALALATLNLEYTAVKAPVTGFVSRRSVEPGQTVQPGQPLMAVVPLEDGARTPGQPSIWVTANFKETQLKHMRVGQPATITVDAYDTRYRGRVESFAAATGARFSLLPPENATGNFVKVVQRVPVRIALEGGQDPQHLLRPGMSVIAVVHTR